VMTKPWYWVHSMNGARPEERRSRIDRKRRWLQAAVVLGGLASLSAVGFLTHKNVEEDTSRRANTKLVRSGIPCELTGEATPVSDGAGFVLVGQCPGGRATVRPTLSLWMQLIEALPSEKRVVILKCGVHGNGSYTDCRKTNEFASRE
jgi:hypothetical protein